MNRLRAAIAEEIFAQVPYDEVVKWDDDVAYVKWCGIKLRAAKETDPDSGAVLGWILDEVVGDVRLHIEQMDTNDYSIVINPVGDPSRTLALNMMAKRSHLVLAANWVD